MSTAHARPPATVDGASLPLVSIPALFFLMGNNPPSVEFSDSRGSEWGLSASTQLAEKQPAAQNDAVRWPRGAAVIHVLPELTEVPNAEPFLCLNDKHSWKGRYQTGESGEHGQHACEKGRGTVCAVCPGGSFVPSELPPACVPGGRHR